MPPRPPSLSSCPFPYTQYHLSHANRMKLTDLIIALLLLSCLQLEITLFNSTEEDDFLSPVLTEEFFSPGEEFFNFFLSFFFLRVHYRLNWEFSDRLPVYLQRKILRHFCLNTRCVILRCFPCSFYPGWQTVHWVSMGDVSHERLYCKDEKWICVWLLIKHFPLSRAETW